MKRKNIALIPAAGIGARFGADKPKQYVEIGGKTVLEYTVCIFQNHPSIDMTVVVVSPEDVLADGFQTAFAGVEVWKIGGRAAPKLSATVWQNCWKPVWRRKPTIFWYTMPPDAACRLKP